MNFELTRRQLVERSAAGALGCALSPYLIGGEILPAVFGAKQRGQLGLDDRVERLGETSIMNRLALQAVDAAKSAGATYADVRLTRTLTEAAEELAVGVRSLVNGYWGFAASNYWRPEEMSALAVAATQQARRNAMGSPRTVDLGQVSRATGTWATPIEIDPFTVPPDEIADWTQAAAAYVNTYRFGFWEKEWGAGLWRYRQERVNANTEGALFSQTIYQTQVTLASQEAMADMHPRQGMGWEIVRDSKWQEQIPLIVEDLERRRRTAIPQKEGTVGRYDVVFSAAAMIDLLDATIGSATELDRAVGMESNSEGTSYMGGDPLAALGSLMVASPLVTVSANRSVPRGLATVKWDDEGVEPQDTTLVRNGVLVDFQTTREQAGWLAPYYQRIGKPVRSNGFSASESALFPSTQMRPNLVLEPGEENVSEADLIRNVKQGLFVPGGTSTVNMDFQGRNGLVDLPLGTREIVNGKLGDYVVFRTGRGGGSFYFNAFELWKNVTAIGGKSSASPFPEPRMVTLVPRSRKGEPSQDVARSMLAVPATIRNLGFVGGV